MAAALTAAVLREAVPYAAGPDGALSHETVYSCSRFRYIEMLNVVYIEMLNVNSRSQR
jgi:hypothetical protein